MSSAETMDAVNPGDIDKIHFVDIDSNLKGGSIWIRQHPPVGVLTLSPGLERSWSPNTVKLRMILNYKRIPYVESFISYPDIRAFGKAHDLPLSYGYNPPRPTCPAILVYDKQGKTIKAMLDSRSIALWLDEIYPNTPIFTLPKFKVDAPGKPTQEGVKDVIWKAWASGYNIVIPTIPGILDDRGREYFLEDRARDHDEGKSPVDWGAENPEDDWKPFTEDMKAMMELFKETTDDAPFLSGKEPCYEDFMLGAFITWFKRGMEANFERIMNIADGQGTNVLRRHYEACRPYIEGQGEVIELRY